MKGLKFVQRICLLSVRFTKFLLTANIEQFFLYNGILYMILGVITWVTIGNVRAFLCNIPAQVSLEGIGCANCADNLLLCGKRECWRQAVNLTIQKDALTPDNFYFQARVESALDIDCNGIMVSSDSTLGLMSGMMDKRSATGGSAPTAACSSFNCKVFLNSVLRTENTDLPGLSTDTCTNTYGLKFASINEPSDCICAPEVTALNLGLSTQIAEFCGNMANGLLGMEMYAQNLRKSKDQCYANSVIGHFEASMASGDGQASNFFAQRNCTYLTQQVYTVFEWFTLKEHEETLYVNGLTPFRFNPASTCVLDFCDIFNTTLYSPSCNWPSEANLLSMTEADLNVVISNCPSKGFTAQGVCAAISYGPSFCAQYVPAVVTTTVAGAGGASSRRLQELPAPVHGAGIPGPCSDGDEDGGHCSPGSADVMRALHGGLTGGPDALHPLPYHPRAAPLPRSPWPRPFAADQAQGRRALAPAGQPEARQLQAAAPAPTPPNNDGLEDWTLSGYGRCQCLQQCVEGVQFRSVSCPSGMRCKEPKPATSQPCICGPCTDCHVDLVLRGMACTYWFQGVSCLLLCAAYYSVSSLTEDDMSDMRCVTKLLGCFCKAWPILVRIVVYVTLMFVAFFAMAVIPGTGFMNDCHSSDALVLLTICTGVCFILQLTLGIIMKRKKTMPPWLYNSVKSGWATLIMVPIRAIGP
uniref:Uncharacterized protein n=1 Tax=Alexandrium catenella TaxID=2925 RepID=A0A7S1W041_ALECA